MLNAMIAFNDGDYVKCIENCNEVIESNNEFKLEALNLRGSLYMLRCQYIQAKEDFALILNSEQASVRIKSNTYIKLTALNLQNGEEEQAFENYEKAIEKLHHKCNVLNLHAILTMDILLYDEFGQLSAELLKILDFIFQKIRDTNTSFGGVLIIAKN